jgi:hypothetical protein
MEIIAIGESWKMRNGQIVKIDGIENADPHPVKSGERLCWQSNGRYWDDDFDSLLDLTQKIASDVS